MSLYIGEIRMFAGNFAPLGWMFCEGQLLSISENDTLFLLIGTTYGGDGQNTFALPDLRGRIPIHMGTGPGGITYLQGEMGGVEQVTLTVSQIPAHSHTLLANDSTGSTSLPQNSVLAKSTSNTPYSPFTPDTTLRSSAISAAGGSQPHDNFQPYLCINFIISLFGEYPTQS